MKKISKRNLLLLILLFTAVFAVSYSQGWFDALEKYRVEGEQFSGGETTVFNESVNAFGEAAPNLTGNKDLFFVTGNAFFKRNWVTPPASTADLDGLGPLFNARSCSSCHLLDGRGSPPKNLNEEPRDLLFRLSRPNANGTGVREDEHYGDQFNHRAVLGVKPEGKVRIHYAEVPGRFADGTSYSLRKPEYEFYNLAYGDFPDDLLISPRIAPHLVGLGLLEAIPESTLQALADSVDENQDGISGRINYVFDVHALEMAAGRFGWKANVPTVRQQTAAAFRGDIGMTSAEFPDEACAKYQPECKDFPSGGEPELTSEIMDRLTLYSQTLAVPARRDWDTKTVLKGKKTFMEIGCTSCHVPQLKTGIHPEHLELSNQVIFPYTDLLLHDMGPALADGRPDGKANGSEWKTPPLWGIGLIKTVSGHTNFLHDGRARNLEEAILWHGGEAEAAKGHFVRLSKEERKNLIIFLNSL